MLTITMTAADLAVALYGPGADREINRGWYCERRGGALGITFTHPASPFADDHGEYYGPVRQIDTSVMVTVRVHANGGGATLTADTDEGLIACERIADSRRPSIGARELRRVLDLA